MFNRFSKSLVGVRAVRSPRGLMFHLAWTVFAGLSACDDSTPATADAASADVASTDVVTADAATKSDVVAADAADLDVVAPDAQVVDVAATPDAATPDAATPTDGPRPSGGDWGFRPMPNGFVFENYGDTPPATNLTAVEMRRLFGPQVCEGAAATGACTLVPQARQWMEQQNTGMSGGHCEGLAVLASNFYSGAVSPDAFGSASTFGLMMSTESLQREIAFWYVSQSTVPNLERSDLTPAQVVDELERDFSRGRAFRGTVLGVYTSPGRGNGHAVTPYAVRRTSATTAEILAYDNNYPNQEKVVTVDLAANTFRYVTSTNPMESPVTYAGDATTRTLTLNPIEPRLALPYACSFCGDAAAMTAGMARGSLQVTTSGDGDVAITDGMGRTTGTDASGAAVNAIPGAAVSRVRSNDLDLDSPEPSYTVPREGTLTITLDGARLRAASQTEMLISGQGFSLGIERINLDPSQRDTVTVRTDSPDVTYRASGAETPTLVLAFQRPGADYEIELRSGAMSAGQVLRLAVDFATQRVRVSFEGSTTAPTFELYMERVSETGTAVFRHAGVAATAASVLQLSYAAWTGDGTALRVEVDANGDGTTDRTDDLSDEP